MTIPYRARLLLSIGSERIELARFRRRINPYDIAYWGADREDRLIVEQPLTNYQTITPRRRITKTPTKMALSRAEHTALETRGVEPEYVQ